MKLILSGLLCVFLLACGDDATHLNSYGALASADLVSVEFNTTDVELLEKTNSWYYTFLVRDETKAVHIVRVYAAADKVEIAAKRTIFKGDD